MGGYPESFCIAMAVKQTKKIKGDLAEGGVYVGGAARVICEAKGNRTLRLFDTFEGHPKVNKKIDICHYKRQFKASLEDTKNYLKIYTKTLI